MEENIKLTSRDNKNRLIRTEIWLHDGYLLLHLHQWTDSEEFAKSGTRCRYAWGSWYVVFESILYAGHAIKLLRDGGAGPLSDWIKKEIEKENERI